jgi:hypothetical protein
MAISEKKLRANRANAQRSTGPRTEAGKAKVARNALVHGLTARVALLPGDDLDQFERLAKRILDELRPDGAFQEELAIEIVNCSWKLRRVPLTERRVLEVHHGSFIPASDASIGDDDFAFPEADIEDPDADDDSMDYRLKPEVVLFKMITAKRAWDHGPNSPAWLVDRYATRIERARASALRMLLTLQKRQRADEDEGADEDGGVDGAVRQASASSGDEAPLQNKPTEASTQQDAQPIASNMDATLDTRAAAEAGAESKATGDDRASAAPVQPEHVDAPDEFPVAREGPSGALRRPTPRATPGRSGAEPRDPAAPGAEEVPRPAEIAPAAPIGEASPAPP